MANEHIRVFTGTIGALATKKFLHGMQKEPDVCWLNDGGLSATLSTTTVTNDSITITNNTGRSSSFAAICWFVHSIIGGSPDVTAIP